MLLITPQITNFRNCEILFLSYLIFCQQMYAILSHFIRLSGAKGSVYFHTTDNCSKYNFIMSEMHFSGFLLFIDRTNQHCIKAGIIVQNIEFCKEWFHVSMNSTARKYYVTL